MPTHVKRPQRDEQLVVNLKYAIVANYSAKKKKNMKGKHTNRYIK